MTCVIWLDTNPPIVVSIRRNDINWYRRTDVMFSGRHIIAKGNWIGGVEGI